MPDQTSENDEDQLGYLDATRLSLGVDGGGLCGGEGLQVVELEEFDAFCVGGFRVDGGVEVEEFVEEGEQVVVWFTFGGKSWASKNVEN